MFISYAQNFEDVMLFRALGHIPHGVYVDVGAQHPTNDSVTKAFYDRGWRGINIDPVQQWQDLLRIERPEDVNLQMAVGAEAGELRFFSVTDTGLSTSDPEIATGYRDNGYSVTETRVPFVPLDQILDDQGLKVIHFLKIDVEGAEREVLLSMAFTEHRPWVVVVEATLPMSTVQTHDRWEDLLLSRRYRFVYADGLNRFYVADEHPELERAFGHPPNVHDGFVRADLIEWQRLAAERHEQATQIHQHATELAAELAPLRNTHRHLADELEQLRSSSTLQHDKDMGQLSATRVEVERFAFERGQLAGQLERSVGSSRAYQNRWELVQAQLAIAENRRHEVQAQLAALQGSTSWAITAPFRLLIKLLRREMTIVQAARRVVGKLLLRFGPRLARNERVRIAGKRLLVHFPNVEFKVRKSLGALPPVASAEVITRSARDLLDAIDNPSTEIRGKR